MSLYDVGRFGELRLAFERRDEKTTLVESYSRPPLQVMRALADEAGCLCIYLLSPTGGIVQNDRYGINIKLHEDTHVLYTTQSATKIYRMPNGCAEQTTRIEVSRGALLEYIPDAAILFADADYHQRTELKLHPGGLALMTDVIMPGRLARGERLQFRRFANRLIVRDTEGLMVYESSHLEPQSSDFNALGQLDGFSCWGTAYVVGDTTAWGFEPQAFALTFTTLLAEVLSANEGIGGVSLLARGGVSIRVLSHRLESIYTVFKALRDHLRTTVHIRPVPPTEVSAQMTREHKRGTDELITERKRQVDDLRCGDGCP